MSKLFSLLFFLYFCSNNNSHFIHVLFLPLYSVLKSLFFRHRLHYFSVKSLTVLYCTLNLRGLHGFSHCLQLPFGLLNQPCAAVRRAAEGRRAAPWLRSLLAQPCLQAAVRRAAVGHRGTHGRPSPPSRRGYGLFWLNLACKPVGPLALPQQGSQAARGARRGASLWPF